MCIRDRTQAGVAALLVRLYLKAEVYIGEARWTEGITCRLYTARAHETDSYLVCRLLLEKKKKKNTK